MANLGSFNPNDHEVEERSFGPVPSGLYVAVIDGSEWRTTKATAHLDDEHQDKYLHLTWKIIEGPHTDRLVWENINLINKDPKTAKNASKDLARICKRCGIHRPPGDSSVLHGRPVKIRVQVRPASNGFEASNEVKGHTMASTAPAAIPVVPVAPVAPVAPAAMAQRTAPQPPWAKPADAQQVEEPPF